MNTLVAQLAEITNPAPKDYDPDSFGEPYRDNGFESSSGESEENDIEAGREHYVHVGKSLLRQNLNLILEDPKYTGKKSSRKVIFNDHFDLEDRLESQIRGDSSRATTQDLATKEMMSDSDSSLSEELEKNESSNHSSLSRSKADVKGNSDTEEDHSPQFSSESEIDDDPTSSTYAEGFDNQMSTYSQSIHQELREIEEDERNLVKKISQNAKADIIKGQHVKAQMDLWDTCLDTRIRLQKALAITNCLPQYDTYQQFTSTKAKLTIEETQKELHELIESLIDLRKDLFHNNENIHISDDAVNTRKRHFKDVDYTENLWNEMQTLHENFLPFRTQTIEKWNNKVQIVSGLPLNKKFKVINQNLNSQIEQILHDHERLLKRTQLKRNDDRIIGKCESDAAKPLNENKGKDEHLSQYDPEIFDDTDFYQQLLRELIESRMVDTDDPIALGIRWAALKQTKQKKKKVDTKASKGRRLRYHVHEKLQNFMVPIPSGTWHEDMIDELYASLLGKKYDTGISSLAENGSNNTPAQLNDDKGAREIPIEIGMDELGILDIR
ncbi:hypothetical protein G9A89_003117 [Geosiphon pyriformis]|nr:hypothetical protein G9A89_003117 [Geosiphon pyriformis]